MLVLGLHIRTYAAYSVGWYDLLFVESCTLELGRPSIPVRTVATSTYINHALCVFSPDRLSNEEHRVGQLLETGNFSAQ